MVTFSAFWALAHVARGAMAVPGPPWIRQWWLLCYRYAELIKRDPIKIRLTKHDFYVADVLSECQTTVSNCWKQIICTKCKGKDNCSSNQVTNNKWLTCPWARQTAGRKRQEKSEPLPSSVSQTCHDTDCQERTPDLNRHDYMYWLAVVQFANFVDCINNILTTFVQSKLDR